MKTDKLIKIDAMKLKNLNKLNKGRDYNLNDDYYGDNKGNVYKKSTGEEKDMYKQMSPYTNRDGYVEYVLTNKDAIKKHIMGHIVCAVLWVPNPLKKPEVNHKDGVRDNNIHSNLGWMDRPENVQHSYDKLRDKK